MTSPDARTGPLAIHLFGQVEICLHGAPVARPRTRKGAWLLALLTLRAGREVERSWLAGALWPDSREAAPTLRRTLTDLRRSLGPEADRLQAPTKPSLRLDLTGAYVDVLAFDAAIASGDPAALEQAVAVYRGPFLEGCGEEWAVAERRPREQAHLDALESLAADARARGEGSAAERWLRQAVSVDPLRESAQRALMQTLAARGSYAAAMRTYRDLRVQLHRELNSRPDPETEALFERLRQERRDRGVGRRFAPGWAADGGAVPSDRARGHNLALPPTPLVGREREVAALRCSLASPETRLITLTGPGGTGKTRLGVEAAAGLLEAFPDGIYMVSLAPIQDPRLVSPTIAQTLEVRESGSLSERESWPQLGQLKAHLREKQILLLLDNFEHLLEAAPLVAELLAAAPRLKVMATSRAALRLRGEKEYPVPPLAVPGVQAFRHSGVQGASGADLNALTRYAAVELFVQRARDVKPDFCVTPENAPAVVALCHRLDGLPLAIELAAARIRLLSPQAMLIRLRGGGPAPVGGSPEGRTTPGPPRDGSTRAGGRFPSLELLIGGARDLPARQQTLRNTITWSYDLLAEAEKRLFRRLAVFVGGCTLEAAEAVSGGGYPPAAALDVIESLVEKSLLRQDEKDLPAADEGGEVRLCMLETIREYGLERLEASGEEDVVRQRHAEFFLDLAERRDGDETVWLDSLEREHDNLRLALAWCLKAVGSGQFRAGVVVEAATTHFVGTPPPPTAVEIARRLATALYRLWYLRGYWSEGRERLAALLVSEGLAPDPSERATLLRRAGQLAWLQGDYPAARRLLSESLTLVRALGNPEDWPAPLNALGEVARTQGDYATAHALFEESRALLLAQGDQGNGAWALQALGELALDQGDPAARSLLEESLALFREVGDRRGIAFALSHLGEAARLQGELRRARGLQEESLQIQCEMGQKSGIARCLGYLARVAADEGEVAAARSLYLECLALRRELGDRRSIASCLEGMAGLAAGVGCWVLGVGPQISQHPGTRGASDPNTQHFTPHVAARLFGTAQALREAIGAPLPPVERGEQEQHVAAVRAVLDEAAFSAAWTAGRSMPLEQTLSLFTPEADPRS